MSTKRKVRLFKAISFVVAVHIMFTVGEIGRSRGVPAAYWSDYAYEAE